MDIVNHLATTIKHFTKKINKWENTIQFGVNDIDNADGNETLFGGFKSESPSTYVELPPIVVETNDKTITSVC